MYFEKIITSDVVFNLLNKYNYYQLTNIDKDNKTNNFYKLVIFSNKNNKKKILIGYNYDLILNIKYEILNESIRNVLTFLKKTDNGYLLFLDIKNTFPSIKIEKLKKCYANNEKYNNFLHSLDNNIYILNINDEQLYYKNEYMPININNNISKEIVQNYIHTLILSKNKNINIISIYVDDILIYCKDLDEIYDIYNNIIDVLTDNELEINSDKTKIYNIETKEIFKLNINNKKLITTNYQEFKYLNVDLNFENNIHSKFKFLMNKYIDYMFNDTSNKDLTTEEITTEKITTKIYHDYNIFLYNLFKYLNNGYKIEHYKALLKIIYTIKDIFHNKGYTNLSIKKLDIYVNKNIKEVNNDKFNNDKFNIDILNTSTDNDNSDNDNSDDNISDSNSIKSGNKKYNTQYNNNIILYNVN